MVSRLLMIVLTGLLCVACVTRPSAVPRSEDLTLQGWKKIAPSKGDKDIAYCANWATQSWDITAVGDAISVSKSSSPMRRDVSAPEAVPEQVRLRAASSRLRAIGGTAQFHEVKDGWLVSTDAGEWGASVWWFAADGSTGYEVSREHVVYFVPLGTRIFALTGLAHLGLSKGSLVEFFRDGDDGWKSREIADLGDAPDHFRLESQTALMVLSRSKLLRISTNGHIETLHTGGQWSWAILRKPNTFAVKDDTIYLGLRLIVSKLERKGGRYNEEWYLPPDCPEIRKLPGIRCMCVGGMGEYWQR